MVTQTPLFEVVHGGPFSDADAQIIGPELLLIEQEQGEVTKQVVLDKARQLSSPLHKHFLWDDAAAAEKHRLASAALMIRSIQIVVQVTGGETIHTRLMVNVSGDDGAKVYRNVNAVIADDDLCKQVIEEARAGLRSWDTKYKSYRRMFTQFRDEFVDIFAAIEHL